jgi:hypothetical protein
MSMTSRSPATPFLMIRAGSGAGDDQRLRAMAVVLANGRRIEFNPDFDAARLRRAVETLEGF